MISKRDKALIYHQRIIFKTRRAFGIASYLKFKSMLEAIAKNISKSAKEASHSAWRGCIDIADNLHKDKNYVVMWWCGWNDD